MSVSGRTRRLVGGWSANLLQLGLGIAQQVALIPVFLYFWTSDVLAAWLTLYAAGNLIFVADAGLQFRNQICKKVSGSRRIRRACAAT